MAESIAKQAKAACPVPRDDSNINPDNYIMNKSVDKMFQESSVWNNYDPSSINKIYKVNDINNIGVSL